MKKIIMIDQDGVVCNSNYQTTKNITNLLKKISEECLIVPNSDTPIIRLRNNFIALLGIETKVVIGEKGAVVDCGKIFLLGGVKKVFIDKYLFEIKKLFTEQKYGVFVGDSATWIRQGKKFFPNSRIIVIDQMRQQTIGLYIKSTDARGNTFTDDHWSNIALSMMEKIPLPKGIAAAEYNSKYGIIVANSLVSSKTTGYLKLREIYNDACFFMIGDQDFDIIDDKQVVHCSVANATAGIKERSSFVSQYKITKGLEECLVWVMKQ